VTDAEDQIALDGETIAATITDKTRCNRGPDGSRSHENSLGLIQNHD